MAVRSRLRLLIALALALTSASVLAVPASAETVLLQCQGICGAYQYTDYDDPLGKGAVCSYETTSHDIDFISIRPPLMHGPYQYKTKVMWRYRIMRAPVGTGVFSSIYLSSWQSAMADDAIPAYAGHGFARRYWFASEDPHGWFKVRVNLNWLNTAGHVIGIARAEYDWYKAIWNGNSTTHHEYCLEAY